MNPNDEDAMHHFKEKDVSKANANKEQSQHTYKGKKPRKGKKEKSKQRIGKKEGTHKVLNRQTRIFQ